VTRTTLAIALLALLPFLPSLGGELVYDDVALIVEDPRVQTGALVDAVRLPYWGLDRRGGLYRPVTTVSYVANGLVSRKPLSFRLVNLALHAGASVLALALARRLLGSERAAFLAAGVFAVHPLHVEVAANVVGRGESLGFLLAGSAWLLAVPAARAGRLRPLALASGLATLGLLAKENALGVALAAPLEVLLLPAGPSWRERVKPAALAAVPAVVAVALSLGARIAVLGAGTLTPGSLGIWRVMNPLADAPLEARLACSPLIFLLYAKNFAWPLSLSPDYGGTFLPLASSLHEGRVLVWGLGALLVLAGPLLATRRRPRELALASGVVLLALAPVLQLVPIGTLAGDRLAYAASFGWALVAGVAGEAALRSARRAVDARLGVAVVLGLLAAVATWNALQWRDTIGLFEWARRRTPGTIQIPLVLASLYIEKDTPELYEKAKDPLREAIAVDPTEPSPHLLLGKVERVLRNFRGAREELERGLALHPVPRDEAGGRAELALALIPLGDFEGAARELGVSCQLNPDPKNIANLGNVLFELKEWNRARGAFEKSLELDPGQARAAEIRARLEKCREALREKR
jgi:tetratricopeptide (TPR) repeat protein